MSAPVAVNDELGLLENTPVVIDRTDLLDNDSDPDGDPIFLIAVSNAVNVSATLRPDGTVALVPPPNYSGPASFDYTISDGHGGTATAHVDIDIQADTNGTPVLAADDHVATNEDTPLVLAPAVLLANDVDNAGDQLTIKVVGNAVGGTVSLDASGNIVFTPAANFSGDASFTYTVSDGHGGTATATVNITVTPVNDVPVAANDTVSATEDTPLVLAPAALLGNDSDVDGDSLTITSVQGATHGTVAISNGNIVFTPAASYNGPASFTYTVSDGHGGTATAAVNVNVAAVDAPVLGQNIVGTSGNDSLVGTTGADTIDGKAGADTMAGGAGNDAYYVDGSGDRIVESAGQGTDTVYAADTHTLGANVENMVITGTWAGSQYYGNELDNLITGNSSSNWIDAGAGNDTIISGGGGDTISGGDGTDTVVFTGKYSDYQVSTDAWGNTIVAALTGSGTATLSHVETLQFADQSYQTGSSSSSGGSSSSGTSGG